MFLKTLQHSQKNILAGVSFLIKLRAGNLELSEAATCDVMPKKKKATGALMFQNKLFIDPLHKIDVFE